MLDIVGEYEPDFEYLLEWTKLLHGRSGAGFSGFSRLSPSVLAEWSRMMDISLHPLEIEALMYLDDVLLVDEQKEDEEERVDETPLVERSYPEWR